MMHRSSLVLHVRSMHFLRLMSSCDLDLTLHLRLSFEIRKRRYIGLSPSSCRVNFSHIGRHAFPPMSWKPPKHESEHSHGQGSEDADWDSPAVGHVGA